MGFEGGEVDVTFEVGVEGLVGIGHFVMGLGV